MVKEFDIVELKDGRIGTIQEVFDDEYWIELDKKSGGPAIEVVKPEDIKTKL